MQKQIELYSGFVLDKVSCPVPGYSLKSVLKYNRKKIRALPWRIKEWDFYQISDNHKCAQFTIGHASYAGDVNITLFDIDNQKILLNDSVMLALPFSRMNMPSCAESDGLLQYKNKRAFQSFAVKDKIRNINACRVNKLDRFAKEKKTDTNNYSFSNPEVSASFQLERKNLNSIVVNIPFLENKNAFYYNQKINCMNADGFVQIGKQKYIFDKKDSFALLDWGRGVWPFHNEWYWSNGSCFIGDKAFGFNLGCGFGNTEYATENIIFYNEKAFKLGKVKFELGKSYMDDWHFVDDEGNLDLVMHPVFDKVTKTKMLWVDNICHQVFGKWNGFVIFYDGTKKERIEISNVTAFAEHAVNNW